MPCSWEYRQGKVRVWWQVKLCDPLVTLGPWMSCTIPVLRDSCLYVKLRNCSGMSAIVISGDNNNNNIIVFQSLVHPPIQALLWHSLFAVTLTLVIFSNNLTAWAFSLRFFNRSIFMGVDHGGTGGTSPPPRIWSGGTLIQIAPPPRFCHIGTKMSVLWPSKYAKIRFRPGLCPGTRWGSSRRSPDPLVGWRGDTPPHMPPQSTRTHLRRSPCVPPEVQPDLRLSTMTYTLWCNKTVIMERRLLRVSRILLRLMRKTPSVVHKPCGSAQRMSGMMELGTYTTHCTAEGWGDAKAPPPPPLPRSNSDAASCRHEHVYRSQIVVAWRIEVYPVIIINDLSYRGWSVVGDAMCLTCAAVKSVSSRAC